MKKVNFSRDEGTAFYRELIEDLNDYFKTHNKSKTGDWRMRIKIVLYFGLDILLYVIMLHSESRLVFFGTYLLMGLSVLLTAFNISHDAAHGVAVKSPFWNKILFAFSFNLQGNNAYVWGKNHNESHHSYTNIEGSDIDVLHNPLFRMSETQRRRWFHRFQVYYAPFLYLLYSLNWFLFRDSLMLFKISSRTISIQLPLIEVFKLVFYKLLYLVYMIGIPALFLPFSWEIVLLAFLLNHAMVSLLFVAVLGVSHVSDLVRHPKMNANDELDMSWPKLQMVTSVDYNPESTIFNWTLGGFNAHTLHHLLPHISHVHYLEVLPIFRKLCTKHGMVYQELSYSDSLKAHFRFLRKMGMPESLISKNYAS